MCLEYGCRRGCSEHELEECDVAACLSWIFTSESRVAYRTRKGHLLRHSARSPHSPSVSCTEVCKTRAKRAGHVGSHIATAYIHVDAAIELHIASSYCVIPAIIIPHAVIPELNYCR